MSEQWESIVCPICGKMIHRRLATPIVSRGRVSSRDARGASAMLAAMALDAEAAHQAAVKAASEACASHYRRRHRARLWLWRRLKWHWLMNRRFPWQERSGEQFDFTRQGSLLT